MELKHRNILITGGTKGIGRELVRLLHPENRLLVLASDGERLSGLSDEFDRVLVHRVDLSDVEQLRKASDELVSTLGGIDLLVNNAAVQCTPTFLDDDFDIGSIEREIAINFTAVCTLTAQLLPVLLQGPGSMVLNINSGLALAPKTSSAVYCATKAALDSFTRSLRYQLEGTGIAVAQAFLPLVDTAMTAGRGSGKLSAEAAAADIIRGVEEGIDDNYVGKARLLAAIMRLSPATGRKIMKSSG